MDGGRCEVGWGGERHYGVERVRMARSQAELGKGCTRRVEGGLP